MNTGAGPADDFECLPPGGEENRAVCAAAWALGRGRAGLRVALRSHPAAPTLGWDLRELQWLDHVGAQLLWNHWQHAWPAQLACTEGQHTMLSRVAGFTTVAPPPEPWRLGDQIDHLGVLVLHGVDHARHLLEMVGQLVLDLVRLARAPRKGPWRDVSGHLYRMGATALPITALV
eukprot:gene42382-56310_t